MNKISNEIDYHLLLKDAYLSIDKLSKKVEKYQKEKSAAIAVIGMGNRFPGGADNPGSYWRVLHDGVDAVSEVPADRWSIDDYYDPDPDAPGKMYSRWGGFIETIDQFDPGFFGISPREATSMDPQQRLLLEVAWETLENAGYAPEKIGDSPTGVFIGISSNDYATLLGDHPQADELYTGTGNAFSISSGRLAYVLGLQGPCMSVDTACSSSLVAVHLAMQSLRNGNCTMAIAGGVNLILRPKPTVVFCKGRMLAFDGRCKTFDETADGYVRGEGCGLVLLKRLSEAISDGDRILAVLLGSAINQDGRSSGLTAPNGVAQESLLKAALADAGIDPQQMDYIEAHGTGTALGDPIEMHALNTVLGKGRSDSRPLWVGSVKTNFGHLEAAAGIAGLIKAILCLRNRKIPPHLHFKTPSSHIPWKDMPIRIPVQPMAWPDKDGRRIAGVSAFGFSGTNAHLVVAEAPEKSAISDGVHRSLHILPISAKDSAAREALVRAYGALLRSTGGGSAADICHTAGAGRSHFSHRVAVIGENSDQLAGKLADIENGKVGPGIFQGMVREGERPPKVAFLFTGQGSQYINMGRQLYDAQPGFRAAMDQCDAFLRPYLDRSLVGILYPKPGEEDTPSRLLEQTGVTQPAMFALEYALAQLWRSWGIEPSAVVGHSVGEYVAACVAGLFSLEDGIKLVAERGRLMQALPAGGSMAVVFTDADKLAPLLAPFNRTVSIAALNGPGNTVISGVAADVQNIVDQLAAEKIESRRLAVSHAFHSPLMEPMLDAFERVAAQVTYKSLRVRLISNLTGETGETDSMSQPGWWRRHVREPVRFGKSIQNLHAEGCKLFLELGPHPTLLGMAARCLPEGEAQWMPSLRRGRNDWQQMLESLGSLYVNGGRINWQGFDRDYARRRVMLPTYAFQRKRYWVDQPESFRSAKPVTASPPESDLDSWLYQLTWRSKDLTSNADSATVAELKRYLIFADRTGLAERLADQLRQKGSDAALVYCNGHGAPDSNGRRAIDPISKESLSEVVGTYLEANGDEPFGIIHMWSLDTDESNNGSKSWLDRTNQSLCSSVLHLVQAIDGLDQIRQTRLWIVTRGAQGGASLSLRHVCQAPLWGLGRVVMTEFPGLIGSLIDLDVDDCAVEEIHLLRELSASDGENQISFYRGLRRVARLSPAAISPAPENGASINQDGSYLITGGLGGLGLHIAAWLAEQGARQLVLVGRNAPSGYAQDAIAAIENKGTSVCVRLVDVSNTDAVQELVREIEADLPPLRGLMHMAGTIDDGVLSSLSWSRFFTVTEPKVSGAWNLHCATRSLELDFFVLFSSASSVFGPVGQANFAAANAFMDALAHYRRAQGLTALSINWSAWSEVGMASHLDRRDQHRIVSEGVEFITKAKGLNILSHLLQRCAKKTDKETAQVVVAPIDWSEFVRSSAKVDRIPLFADLVEEHGISAGQPEPGLTKAALLAADPENRKGLVEAYLARIVAREMMIPQHDLDIHQPITMLGFDSLMAVKVRNEIERDFDITLAIAELLGGNSVSVIAGLLCDQLQAHFKVGATDRQPTIQSTVENIAEIDRNITPEEALTLLENIDDLSDEQVSALLEKVSPTQDGKDND